MSYLQSLVVGENDSLRCGRTRRRLLSRVGSGVHVHWGECAAGCSVPELTKPGLLVTSGAVVLEMQLGAACDRSGVRLEPLSAVLN